MKKLVFLFVAICLAFSSCKTKERIEYRDRYVDHYITQVKHDTLREHTTDSVYLEVMQKGDTIYKCVQAHTTQSDWTPDITPALWTVVSLDEFPEWVQPQGAHDAYNQGDKVSHLEKHWVSDIDANVYEPSVYGWSEAN
jgi:hypothetical protein